MTSNIMYSLTLSTQNMFNSEKLKAPLSKLTKPNILLLVVLLVLQLLREAISSDLPITEASGSHKLGNTKNATPPFTTEVFCQANTRILRHIR